jgi:spermidine synthase
VLCAFQKQHGKRRYSGMAVRIAVLMLMAGFAASIGQILVIRELLVIFYGNELSTGLILACWLLCTAAGSGLIGRVCTKKAPDFKVLLAGFAAFCAALPATIVWIRAARAFWAIPPGELLSPGMMLVIGFCAAAPICFLSGGLFALAWELCCAGAKSEERPISVYLAESLGAGAGGLVFYFILLPLYPSFAGSLLLIFFLLAGAMVAGARLKYPGKVLCSLFLAAILIAASILFSYSDRVDLLTRRMQWGKSFFQSRDTPFHNLVFLFNSGQFSLFSNGLWLFSSPDPQSAEPAAYLPLLEHPDPGRVLVIGDYSPELLGEVVNHPGINSVDCVQPDAEATAFTAVVLPPSHVEIGGDRRLRLWHIDPRRFRGGVGIGYDVILLSAGEPVNAEMNRFYTVEFFARIKSLMNPAGLFSFGVPAAPDIVGPREAVLLKSLYATLREVFGYVLILPGENVRFIASQDGAGVTGDPLVLIDRMRARRLNLRYVQDFYLLDLFNPIRLAYMESIIHEGPPAKINRDFEPVCYLYGLGLWGAQLHPAAGRFLGFISGGAPFPVLVGFGAFFLVFVSVLLARGGTNSVVAFNTGVCGAVLIVIEVVLLLVYQIIEGSVYRQMALIISLFMAGLAAGSALAGTLPGRSAHRLFMIQIGLAAYLGALYLLFSVFRGSVLDNLGHASMLLLFSALAFLAGMFGGGQFSAAVACTEKVRGAGLYAADLVGASAGAVAGSLFFLPVLGIPKTLLTLGLGCLAASATLLKNPTS